MDFPNEVCPICNDILKNRISPEKGWLFFCSKGHYCDQKLDIGNIIRVGDKIWHFSNNLDRPSEWEVQRHIDKIKYSKDDDPSFYKYGL